jgi:type IV pilus assembly protein PilO
MAGMPTNQRDQVMLLVGILGIGLGAAYWNFQYHPKSVEIAEQRIRVEMLDAANQRAKALLARGTVEELQAEAKLLRDNLDLMRTLIPAGNEVAALLDQIVGAARRSGLEIESFAPGATTPGEEFDTYRYTMSLKGSYHQIGDLLASIGSLRRIIAPVNVNLSPAQEPGRTQVAADEQVLSASFDLQTYVVRTTPSGEGETP